MVTRLLLLLPLISNAATWTPQEGVYQKLKSDSGKVKYVKVTIPPAIPPECELKFYCDTSWGAIYDMNQNKALECPRVYIKKNELGYFDGKQMIDACKN